MLAIKASMVSREGMLRAVRTTRTRLNFLAGSSVLAPDSTMWRVIRLSIPRVLFARWGAYFAATLRQQAEASAEFHASAASVPLMVSRRIVKISR
jgi:hypothetical protein